MKVKDELKREIKFLEKECLKYIGVPSGSGYINTDPYYFQLLKEIRTKKNILEGLE